MTIAQGVFARQMFFLFVAFFTILAGCARDEVLLKNPELKSTDKGAIKSWSVEGDGAVKAASYGGVEFTASSGAPFFYQQVPARKRHKNANITFGAWVMANQPETVYIEFSNRLGTDQRSDAHPGDGKWHLLTQTVRVPEASETLEFRLRSARPSTAYMKEAFMSPGFTVPTDGVSPGLDAPAYVTVIVQGSLLVLMLGIVVRFQRLSDTLETRLTEVFGVLIFLSAIALVFGRSSNAAVVANIAWASGCAGGILFIRQRALESRPSVMPRAEAVIVLVMSALIFVVVVALKDGMVSFAGKSALWAYVLFISSIVYIPLIRLYRRARERRPGRLTVRVYKAPEAGGGVGKMLSPQASTSEDVQTAEYRADGHLTGSETREVS